MKKFKTALITGGSGGIGAGVGKLLAARGTHVVLAARRRMQLDAVVDAIRAAGGTASALELDVGDASAVVAAVERLDDETGGLDLVIANAGVGSFGHAKKLTWAAVEPMIRVNFVGAIATLSAALPRMVARRRGQLVGVSSLAAFRGMPTSAAYSATKAGLSTFLEGLRVDLRGTGVLATTIHPGFVRTDMTAANRFPMPFLMDLDDACDVIVRGLERGDRVIDFPRPMVAAVRALAAMPDALYEAVASRQRVAR